MSYQDSTLVLIDTTHSEIAEKRTNTITQHRSVFSRVDLEAGQVLSDFSAKKIYSEPSYLTVQISDTEHIELWPEYLECVNHSCDPNCYFDTTTYKFITLKPVKAGEELTFFYPSTEWDMDKAFQCLCGSDQCLGIIQGAKYLSDEQSRKYRFSDFIQKKLALRNK
jgi:SET domain